MMRVWPIWKNFFVKQKFWYGTTDFVYMVKSSVLWDENQLKKSALNMTKGNLIYLTSNKVRPKRSTAASN